MSEQYDDYICTHKKNVIKGFNWFTDNLPEIIKDEHTITEIIYEHDKSKYEPIEYHAYDAYFYGKNRSHKVVEDFRLAWLNHIHNNPHHWQHWVLINDEPNEGMIIMDMPYQYIVEMICDWWAFSWKTGNLNEIFKWYDEHKSHMKLSDTTRKTVESILDKMKEKLSQGGKVDEY